MRFTSLVALGLGLALLAPTLHADAEGWHPTLKKGLEASAKSGKPLLVITTWKRTL